jgi:protein-S-isoprenylcysteine O-methyltransferase Ste14
MQSKVIASVLGFSCHMAFFAAIACMAYMLFFGLTRGILPVNDHALIINLILLFQFPILHSFFLSKSGRKILVMILPKDLGKDLVTTTFALISSLQLLAVFVFWTPASLPWNDPHGAKLIVWTIIYVASWLLLIKALNEAGLALQTGFLGWSSVVKGEKPKYPSIPTSGLHAVCRQPIYLSFSLILLTAPIWSLDHLLITALWVVYCFIGPKLKERRLIAIHGDAYREYQTKTPYILPKQILALINKSN